MEEVFTSFTLLSNSSSIITEKNTQLQVNALNLKLSPAREMYLTQSMKGESTHATEYIIMIICYKIVVVVVCSSSSH